MLYTRWQYIIHKIFVLMFDIVQSTDHPVSEVICLTWQQHVIEL